VGQEWAQNYNELCHSDNSDQAFLRLETTIFGVEMNRWSWNNDDTTYMLSLIALVELHFVKLCELLQHKIDIREEAADETAKRILYTLSILKHRLPPDTTRLCLSFFADFFLLILPFFLERVLITDSNVFCVCVMLFSWLS